MRRSGAVLAVLVVAALLVSCGGGDGHATRTVLIDYKLDEFVSSFLTYYPQTVRVHPGDTVRFKQTWTGEPHSVTMGRVVDRVFKYEWIFEKYESEEDARANGVSEATIDKINATFGHLPPMGDNNNEIYQPGARPCVITRLADVSEYTDAEEHNLYGKAADCPAKGQPAFTGRQAIYNSGYIPWQGSGANEFVVNIAQDATPGTYKYFCNYHWTFMNGTVKIVPESQQIPSNNATNRAAIDLIRKDSRKPLAAVRKAQRAYSETGTKVLAGTDDSGPDDLRYVGANEFFPTKLHTQVGEPVTWSFKGVLAHTVSFNVPAYFPVFTIDRKGDVHYDKRAQDAVRWQVPERQFDDGHNQVPRKADAGSWDGSGGFHSSGLLAEGDTFTLHFTKPGTYPYACAVHPQMIGQVAVTA